MCSPVSALPIASNRIVNMPTSFFVSPSFRGSLHLGRSSSTATCSIRSNTFVPRYRSKCLAKSHLKPLGRLLHVSRQTMCVKAELSVGRAQRAIDLATTLFPVWVALGAVAAIAHPPTFLWFSSAYITPTLGLIMLGMGLTISPSSFAAIFATPHRVILGALAQYTIMPCLAKLLAMLLRLPTHLAVGLILVGVCPGGAASNLVCLIGQADVALSVVLTLVSTLLSVALIPLLMQVLASTLVPVSPQALLFSTAQVVLFPLISGSLLKRVFPGVIQRVLRILPLISVLGVTFICGGVVAANASALAHVGPRLVFALALLHGTGGLCGYLLARLFRLPARSARTVSIEVMMQNSSLAVSLANLHFANPLTAIPGAISATMHSVFGSILAGVWRISDMMMQGTAHGQNAERERDDGKQVALGRTERGGRLEE